MPVNFGITRTITVEISNDNTLDVNVYDMFLKKSTSLVLGNALSFFLYLPKCYYDDFYATKQIYDTTDKHN